MVEKLQINNLIEGNMQPILSVKCNEKDGTITRHIYPFVHTRESLNKFYEKSKDLKTIFSREFFGDFEKFMATFFTKDKEGNPVPQGLFWIVDDFVGMFYLTDIYPGIDAQCHYLFFDKRHYGREELTKEMLRYLFDEFKFHRLSVELPNYASPSTRRFIMNIGFSYEGKKRQNSRLNNTWFDTNIYGVLKEDLVTSEIID
jgi:RimJ/RimL family protein N-acetyltransferase